LSEYRRIAGYFAPVDLPAAASARAALARAARDNPAFARWYRSNVMPHHTQGYANVSLSLKSAGRPPGDAAASEMEVMASLAETYGRGELRVTYTQNIIIPHVRRDQLTALFEDALKAGLAGAEEGLISDMIACPGLDYCNLANARSLPLAEKIFQRFPDPDRRAEIGKLRLNISGCINACGHHHAADIGILGVNKKGVEHYQISLGGRADEAAAIGRIIGPSFAEDEVPAVIEEIVNVYLAGRERDERFADHLLRVGLTPFKQAVYGDD
jgi:sulfite reductase (NADPH) hemoprotein beta-component